MAGGDGFKKPDRKRRSKSIKVKTKVSLGSGNLHVMNANFDKRKSRKKDAVFGNHRTTHHSAVCRDLHTRRESFSASSESTSPFL